MTGCARAGTSLRGNLKGTGTLVMMSRDLRDPADFSMSLFLMISIFLMRMIINDKYKGSHPVRKVQFFLTLFKRGGGGHSGRI